MSFPALSEGRDSTDAERDDHRDFAETRRRTSGKDEMRGRITIDRNSARDAAIVLRHALFR